MKFYKIRTYLFVVIFILGGSFPSLAQEVAKNSQWAVYLDMDKYKESAIFKTFMDLDREGEYDRIRSFLRSEYDFDPRTDLESVTAYGNGKRYNVVLVLKGKFDSDKILKTVKQRKNHELTLIDGYSCHSFIGFDKKEKHLAFMNDETLVISGSHANLADALQMKSDERESIGSRVIHSASDDIVATGFINVTEVDLKETKSGILSQLMGMDFVLTTEEKGIRYSMGIRARDELEAGNLYTIMRGVFARFRMGNRENPEFSDFFNHDLHLSLQGKTLIISTDVIGKDLVERAVMEIFPKLPSSWFQNNK